jgi:flagellar biosynthetic protein FliS
MSASLVYRRAMTEQASPVGLVIALYDTLVADFQRAIAAMERTDLGAIQERSNQLKHALQILMQLNALLDMRNGGTCAQNLATFYEHLRRRILAAQFEKRAAILEAEIPNILHVRSAWQQIDSRSEAVQADAGMGKEPDAHSPTQRPSFSCSA